MGWIRFSLAGLLLLVAVVGGGAGYYLQQRREAETARHELERITAGYQAGILTFDEYAAASRRFCLELCDVPFADRQRALSSYRETLEGELNAIICFVDGEFLDRRTKMLRPYVEEAGRWADQGFPSGAR